MDLDGGTIHELSYTPGSQPPTSVAKVTPTSGAAPLTVSFDGTGSSDPQSETLSYAWNFGDGTTSTAVSGTHTYTAAGTYTADLDGDGHRGAHGLLVCGRQGSWSGQREDHQPEGERQEPDRDGTHEVPRRRPA